MVGGMKTTIWKQEKFIRLVGQLGYRDRVNGPLVAYKRIITIAGCANIVSSFVTSF